MGKSAPLGYVRVFLYKSEVYGVFRDIKNALRVLTLISANLQDGGLSVSTAALVIILSAITQGHSFVAMKTLCTFKKFNS